MPAPEDQAPAADEPEAAPYVTDEQTEQDVVEIQQILEARETENLLEIWRQNDREAWTPEAFEAIRRILAERLGQVPRQPAHLAEAAPEAPPVDDEAQIEQAAAHLDRADELIEADELEAVLAECEAAVQLAPHWAEARYYRAMALEELGELEEAIADYEAAIRFYPKYYAARDSLAQVKVKLAEAQAWLPEADDASGAPVDWAVPDEAPGSTSDLTELAAETPEGDAELPPFYLDEKAQLMRGWPGHRQRPGRSGYDPLEMDFELAHMEGVFLRKLIKLELRTRNPFYPGVMAVGGILGLLPGLFVPFALYDVGVGGCFILPAVIPGALLLANLLVNLRSLGEPADDAPA